MVIANEMAKKMGIHETGYRVFTNAGAGGGQTVFHLHFHLVSPDFPGLKID
jgi:histidine triad (HIT) family protein